MAFKYYDDAISCGVQQQTRCEAANTIINRYLSLFDLDKLLHLLVESGLAIYLLFYLLVIAIWKKSQAVVYFAPVLGVIFSLYLATSVYSHQRYIYAVYVTLPFIIITTFMGTKKREENETK